MPASPVLIWAGAIGMGLTMAPVFPNTFGYAQHVLGLTGKLTGWFLVGSSAGSMFWPWLIGQYFNRLGPQFMIWVVVFNVACALVTIGFMISQSSRGVINNEANVSPAA